MMNFIQRLMSFAVFAMLLTSCLYPLPDGSPCPITEPNGKVPPGENPSPAYHANDNGTIGTALWPHGIVVFIPGGSGEIHADGSLSMKWPWWVTVPDELTVEGRRLDAEAPPLQVDFSSGAVPGYFENSAITFSTEGCWEVTATAGDHTLTLVTLVIKVGAETG